MSEQNLNVNQVPKTAKKPIYKNWWFWVVIVVIVAIIVGNTINKGFVDPNETNNTTSKTVAVNNNVKTEKKTTEKTKATKSAKQIRKEYIKSCKTITFDKLGRNPNKYKGQKFKITGQVIQVQEGWGDSVDLRINMTKTTYEYIDDVTWSDTIYATVEIGEDEDKILEDDIITIYGECDGDYTYESVMGSNITLPKINIEYFEINND